MAKYKFVLSYEIENDSKEESIQQGMQILGNMEHVLSELWTVSLTRDGDRSAANLLAPVQGTTHYRNHKILVTEVKPLT